MSGILPPRAASCGLITKTDAERLCSALVHNNPERSLDPPSAHCIRVYHNCFGKGDGHFSPDLYTNPDAKCIHCVECKGLFPPSKFVCHSHKALENRTCHWGFDSDRWRDYLLVKDKKFQDALEDLKARFDSKHKHKRRQSPEREGYEQKRAKTEAALVQDVIAWGEATSGRDGSAFQPWAPSLHSSIKGSKLLPLQAHIMRDGTIPSYLHTGPPVLLNPERVIPYSESQRYERHFTPNVSLAPTSKGKPEEVEGQADLLALKVKAREESKSSSTSGPSGMTVESGRDYREYDLPTDTDDSSVGQSSPIDVREEIRLSESPVFESTLEQELVMIHRALDGKVVNSKEARDGFLHEYSKLRARHEEQVHSLYRDRQMLRRELSVVHSQNEDFCCKIRALQNELEGLRLDGERRVRQAQDEQIRLARRLADLQSEAGQETPDKSARNCELKTRLQHFESLYQDLQQENTTLRTELQRRGVNIVELLAQKNQPTLNSGPLKNGTASSSSFLGMVLPQGQRSCDKLKVVVDGNGNSTHNGFTASATTRAPKTLPPKKERDLIID